jgi:hypothetical protein
MHDTQELLTDVALLALQAVFLHHLCPRLEKNVLRTAHRDLMSESPHVTELTKPQKHRLNLKAPTKPHIIMN